MRPTQNFRMHKAIKALIELLPSKDADQRAAFRAMMVQAQLQGAMRIKADPKRPARPANVVDAALNPASAE